MCGVASSCAAGSYLPLVQVSYAVVAPVVVARIGYVKLTHEFGKVGFWGFEKQMEMVGHENVTVKLDRVDI